MTPPTPERLNSWIYRPVTGSKTLVLLHEPPLGQPSSIAMWTREDVEQVREQNGSQGEDVITAAREHMEGSDARETCKFSLQWLGERKSEPLRSTVFKLQPEQNANESLLPNDIAALSGGLIATIVPQLLGHIAQQQRTTVGTFGVSLAAHERTNAMQQRTIELQQKQIETLLELLHSRDEEGSNDYKEAKARALDKLIGALPTFVNAGVALAASKLGVAPPQLTSEARKAAAVAALKELDPSEIAALADDDEANGAADDAH